MSDEKKEKNKKGIDLLVAYEKTNENLKTIVNTLIRKLLFDIIKVKIIKD